jgi:hypothetical protein
MSHSNRGDFTFKFAQGLGDRLFGFSIKGARGLVQYQQSRPGVERSRKSQALSLTTTEPNATLTNNCVQALASVAKKSGKVGSLESLPHHGVVNSQFG